jgi:hypothetical protein
MDFKYTRRGLTKKEKVLERFLEIVPGGLSWLILIGMSVLSFVKPLPAAVIIIAFILYWLLRMTYMNLLLVLSYARFNIEKNTNWMQRVEKIDSLDFSRKKIDVKNIHSDWRSRISDLICRRQMEHLLKKAAPPLQSKDIFHVVIIPVAKETRTIVEPGIIAVKNGSFPPKRILLVIALEERAPDDVQNQMYKLREKHKAAFLDFLVVLHPPDLPGEARVKGANTTFAARLVAEYLSQKGIPYENVIASCFDADTVPVPDYFSCLTYYFMLTPKRTQCSFQPIPVYFNNVWNVPGFARIMDVGASFFQLVEATNPRKLITFSSHSVSFKALVDVDYWPTDIVSDDSAIFWKALLHYNGDYQTIPMPIAVSMDIVVGPNIRGTLVNIYKQKRRWAWGVENFPVVIRGFLHSRKFPFYKKVSYALRLIDKFTSWATWSFLLAFISWMPMLSPRKEFAATTIYYIAPRIRATVFFLASFGLLTCILTSMLLLPPEKAKHPLLKKLLRAGEWLLIPIVVLVLSALPALDAQTRLMFGKYMEFWVTDKYRPKPK